ncbi:glycosyltransferase [Thermoflavifilum thermophilum]|uniref:Glycosyl transferase family 28 C-terminal domain-containing protein n=1 Tax=Thermoflavifilum thermophilum TaxID=1393122 RepID=A0A1I7N832_9BACT|nr:glycosyltransferase [Thermoflavifilum thermophilum]SFV30808.1 conserved hypothetical protein [Thermoflavifilum thermophilum]
MTSKRILVAPLDWGLGHATRCIPIVRELLVQGCEVWLAAEGKHARLLQLEFPDLPILTLKGYRIRYTHHNHGKWFAWNIVRQIPRIFSTIRYEHEWLQKMQRHYRFDAIISDNRFGLFHPDIPCVFMTHQLQILVPGWMEKLPGPSAWLRQLNYRYIRRFAACWIPDWPGSINLAGKLSHPANLPDHVSYIGPLSRFAALPDMRKKHDVVALISGPEPQRSLLEKLLIAQLKDAPLQALLIRGRPDEPFQEISINSHLTIITHLPTAQLNEVMQSAHAVISRSGYTTIMDLVAMNQKAILIPTPGQTEQEYLAVYHQQQGIFPYCSQSQFHWQQQLPQLSLYPSPATHFPLPMDMYKSRIATFLNSL